MALYTQNNPEYFGEGHTGPAENAMKWSNIMPKYAGQLLPYLAGQLNANMQHNRANGDTSTKIGVMTP